MSEADLGPWALALLCLISIASGLAMLWTVRRLADQTALARAKDLIAAHLLEFRLFGDEPRLVLRAQRDVAWQSARVVWMLLGPAAAMLLPMLLLFGQLEAVFGLAPLRPGEAAVVTVHWTGGGGVAPRLEAGAGVRVDSAAVRANGQTSWRIRPTESGAGWLRVTGPGGEVLTKSVQTGWGGLAYVSERRVRPGLEFLIHPTEAPLASGAVKSIDIGYRRAVVWGLPWLSWFLLVSGVVVVAGSWR